MSEEVGWRSGIDPLPGKPLQHLHRQRTTETPIQFIPIIQQRPLVAPQEPGPGRPQAFFDTLVTRHAAPLNPFQSVRSRKHGTSDGKTPGLSIPQGQDLLGSIDTSHVVGLRDRALLGTLAYTGARIGAVARLRRGDLDDQGAQRVLRFREKGGKQREIPVRHDLDRWLGDYLEAAGINADPKETPLFRSALGKQKQLSPRPLSANSMGLMLKRRLKDAGLPPIFSPHSFRVLVVTDLLSQDVSLEDVQYLAGHANPRTTQIYDRRRVTRNIVERISV